MIFKYSGANLAGRIQNGQLEAKNSKAAVAVLKQKGLTVLKIEPLVGKAKGLGKIEISLGLISHLDRLLFVKHLALMIEAGLNIGEALTVLSDQSDNKRFSKIIREVRNKVMAGQTLAGSLAAFPKVFNELFVNLIKVGEVSGKLEESLRQLALQMQKDYEIRKKVRGAMIYPVFVLSFTVALGMALAFFILPKLIPLFQSFNLKLPWTTRLVLTLGQFLQNDFWYILGGVAFLVIVLPIIFRRNSVKPGWHRLLLRLPVIGKISSDYNLARFTRILGLLLKSGVPIIEALRVTAHAMTNVIYREQILAISREASTGVNLLVATQKRAHFFPVMISRMIGVGERSGRLDDTLSYLADFYEAEVDNTTRNLTSILEPLLLVVIGLVVGGVAISIISPIYQLTGQIGR